MKHTPQDIIDAALSILFVIGFFVALFYGCNARAADQIPYYINDPRNTAARYALLPNCAASGLAMTWDATTNEVKCVGSGGGVGSGYVLVDGSLNPDMTGPMHIQGPGATFTLDDTSGANGIAMTLTNDTAHFGSFNGLSIFLSTSLYAKGLIAHANSQAVHIRNINANIPTWLQNSQADTGAEAGLANDGVVIGPTTTNDAHNNDKLLRVGTGITLNFDLTRVSTINDKFFVRGDGYVEVASTGDFCISGGACLSTAGGGGGGGGNFELVEVDFGASGSTIAEEQDVPAAWVAAGSSITCTPTMFATADRADGEEDAIVEEIHCAAYGIVVSTSFDVKCIGPNEGAVGKYLVSCTGGTP